MHIVKFTRTDTSIKKYWYPQQTDAKYHFSLFIGDDSNLYSKIELLNEDILLKYIDIP